MQGVDSLRHHLAQYADSSLRQQIFTRIDLLGQKLGIAAAHIWAVLVRQAYAQAAMNTLFFIMCLISLYWVNKWSRKLWATDEEGLQFLSVILVVGFGITTIVAAVSFIDAVGYIINPEYFAFNTIMEWIKGPGR